MSWLYVFLGGGLGSLARYGIGRWWPPIELLRGDFPWPTFWANVLACGVLGLGVALASREWLGRPLQLLLLTGFCGGFSTFSTFALELFGLGEEGHWPVLVSYLLSSLLVGVGTLGGLIWWLR